MKYQKCKFESKISGSSSGWQAKQELKDLV